MCRRREGWRSNLISGSVSRVSRWDRVVGGSPSPSRVMTLKSKTVTCSGWDVWGCGFRWELPGRIRLLRLGAEVADETEAEKMTAGPWRSLVRLLIRNVHMVAYS